MNAERWRQIDELFDAVLDLPEAERERFLSEKCGGDEELRREVLSLVRAQVSSEKFMENSAMRVAAKNLAAAAAAGGADEQAVTTRSFRPGQRIGAYEIERLIGVGGMGEVYLAQDTRLNRKVALKLLPPEFTADPERVRRFEREARAVSALNHPYIVTIYDVGGANAENGNGNGGGPATNYIAAEYVEGETVRDLINRAGAGGVDLKQTLSIASQVCEALSAAHKAGIIHRDVKPENIMIRPDGYVKVLDFGLAKLADQAEFAGSLSDYTQKGIIIGTPAYMSPAQVGGGERLDQRTDLWSLGVVLYEMLAGVNPFKGENRQSTFQKILSEQPPPVSELKPALPAELDRILEKALERDPDLSYQTASDLRADLRRVRREIDSSPSLRSSSSTQGRGAAEANRRRNYFLPFAFLLLLLPAALLGVWFFALRPKTPPAADWTKADNAQLTAQPGTEFFPSLAPDGKSFVYASDAEGNFDIYLQRVGSKRSENLTPDSPDDDTMPSFSPDGERVAFRSDRESGAGIYVMETTGENLRRVSDFGFHPSWSPDGREIVVSTFGRDQPNVFPDGEQGLWVINVETGARRELTKTVASLPSWSPSGKRVAFWFYEGNSGRRHVATIPAHGGGGGEAVVVAKDFAVSNWNPVWSPDGNFLYFVSSRKGDMNFWRVRIDEASGEVSGDPEPVITPSKFSRHLNFSRDGRRMIYVQTNNRSNIQGVEFDAEKGRVLGEPFWITEGDREISRAELSPDGARFHMRVIKRTQDDLVSVSRDGRDWRDVTDDLFFDRYPRWSPDGKRIAFGSDRSGFGNVWVCDADGGNLRQITFHDDPRFGAPNHPAGFPVWSPDGERLAVHHSGTTYLLDPSRSWREQTPAKLPAAGNGEHFVVWDWSPDGKKLGGVINGVNRRFVTYYSFETDRYEKLVETAEHLPPAWLPDSRHVVYGHKNKIVLVDTATKRTRELVSRPGLELRSPFVSRDGRLLYYTAHSAESDIWLLDLSQNK